MKFKCKFNLCNIFLFLYLEVTENEISDPSGPATLSSSLWKYIQIQICLAKALPVNPRGVERSGKGLQKKLSPLPWLRWTL